MAGGWGDPRNKVRIGVFWDSIEYNADKSQARIKGARVRIDRGVPISDSSNEWFTSGAAIVDEDWVNSDVGGSGEKTIRTLDGQWNNLSYTEETTVTFSARAEHIDYAGDTLFASRQVTFIKRPVSVPDPPTSLVVSGSGSSRTLTWDYTSTTAKPVTKTIVQVQLDTGSYAPLGQPTSKTITASGLPDNSRIRFRAATANASGQSDWVYSAYTYTKPAAPTDTTATKLVDGSVQVSATDKSAWETSFEFRDSPDGSTWEAPVSNPTATWIHTSPSLAVTHRYQVRAKLADGQTSDWSATSNVIALLSKPNPPTNLSPNGAARDPDRAIPFSWKRSHPDSTPQTKYQFRSRMSSGDPWTTSAETSSSTEQMIVPAGTFSAGTLEWQVRTLGLHADWSDWSASAYATLAPSPLTSISSPGLSVGTSRLVVELGYSDPGGSPQASGTVRVTRDGETTPFLTLSGSGSATIYDFSSTPLDEGVYLIEAETVNSLGLHSDVAEMWITVTYLPPVTPEVFSTSWDPVAGSLSISTSNALGDGTTTADTVSQSLYRVTGGARQLVATGDPDATFLDETPATLGQEYVLVAWTEEGARSETVFTVDPDDSVLGWFYIWKPEAQARFKAGVKRTRSASLAVTVDQYAGRAEAVSTYGVGISEETGFSMLLFPEAEGTDWLQLRRVALTPGDAIVRSPDGLRFRGAIGSTGATDSNLIYQEATLSITHVGV